MLRKPFLVAGRSRWAVLVAAVASIVTMFVATSAAQATVVDDQGTFAGVALVNNTGLSGSSVTAVTSPGPCSDPWLSSDFSLPNSGLCWHSGGRVVNANETFALTWDAPTASNQHAYWAGTRGYVEQFLRDVASGSGTFTSPYALTGQYQSPTGPAANNSVFGGGCIDYGSVGGSACDFGNGNGAGHDFATGGCTPTGSSWGATGANSVCLTDSQIQSELSAMVTQTGIIGHTKTGYSPLVVLLTPPGVETCLDASGYLCSANSASPTAAGQFCSYHSHMNVNGTDITYVVQPWVANGPCDDASDPKIPDNPTPPQLATAAGLRLVNPLSRAELGAITNPDLNGWSALNGSEIDDNGCVSLPNNLDQVAVGTSSQNPYFLQREFNNAGVISSDPYTYFGCAPEVILSPNFVVPSSVNQGDVVAFDGSSTATTLLIPNSGYQWKFGDGATASGPSVEHSYSKGGTYTVTLTVTDRGGDKASLSQDIVVLGATGQPSSNQPGQQGGSGSSAAPLHVHLQLLPMGFRQVLRAGIPVRLTSSGKASGFASVSVSRAIAKRLHLRVGRARSVVIGRGFVSEILGGTATLHLYLSRGTVARLKGFRHLSLTVTLALVGAAGDHLTIDAAGRY